MSKITLYIINIIISVWEELNTSTAIKFLHSYIPFRVTSQFQNPCFSSSSGLLLTFKKVRDHILLNFLLFGLLYCVLILFLLCVEAVWILRSQRDAASRYYSPKFMHSNSWVSQYENASFYHENHVIGVRTVKEFHTLFLQPLNPTL